MVATVLLVVNVNHPYVLVPSVCQTATPPKQSVYTPMIASVPTTRNANQPTVTPLLANVPLLALTPPIKESMMMDVSAALMMNVTPPIAHLKHVHPYAPKTPLLGSMSTDVSVPQTSSATPASV